MSATGDRLGSYRLQGVLGSGAMGIVYRAEHTLIKRQVAIKVLAGQWQREPEIIERFFVEAQAANRACHDGIIDVTDFVVGTGDEPSYMVMEFLDGESLDAVLQREGRLDVEEVALLGTRVADAMAAAHDAGVIHRDLKPENIFLRRRDGELGVKIIDFGVAAITESPTTDSFLVGTPLYMAPEQAGADPTDARADIYALGGVLYRALTGEPPFGYDTVRDLLVAHISEAPSAPSQRNRMAYIPEAVDELLLQCLAKDPDDRPESMHEVRRRLEQFLRGDRRLDRIAARAAETMSSEPLPLLPQPELRGRGRKLLGAVALAAVALTASAAAMRAMDGSTPIPGAASAGGDAERLLEHRLMTTARDLLDDPAPDGMSFHTEEVESVIGGSRDPRLSSAGPEAVSDAATGVPSPPSAGAPVGLDQTSPRSRGRSRAETGTTIAEAPSVVVDLASDPAQASVYLDDVVIGATPMQLVFPPLEGESSLRVRLRKKGYKEKVILLSSTPPPRMRVELEELGEAEPEPAVGDEIRRRKPAKRHRLRRRKDRQRELANSMELRKHAVLNPFGD